MPHFPQFPAAHSFCPLTPTFLCLSSSLSVSWRMSICLVWRGSKEGVLTGWQDREGDKCSDLGLLLTQTSVRVRRREFEREKKGNQAKHRHLWALRQILHHLARTRSPLNQPRQVPKDLLQPSPAIPWFISLPWPIQHTLAPPALHGSRTITSKMQPQVDYHLLGLFPSALLYPQPPGRHPTPQSAFYLISQYYIGNRRHPAGLSVGWWISPASAEEMRPQWGCLCERRQVESCPPWLLPRLPTSFIACNFRIRESSSCCWLSPGASGAGSRCSWNKRLWAHFNSDLSPLKSRPEIKPQDVERSCSEANFLSPFHGPSLLQELFNTPPNCSHQLSPLSPGQNSFFFQKEIKDHLSQLGRASGKGLQ